MNAQRLHPHLQACVKNTTLHHPLLGKRPYAAPFNAIYNREYRSKQALLQQAKALGNWLNVILLHDRPFRPLALQQFSTMMSDDAYWRLVAEVWIDADVNANKRRWTQIWSSPRPCRDQIMTPAEHQVLANIREGAVVIYRGCDPETINGLSWTFGPDAASDTPIMVTATIAKRHIQAYFTRRRRGRPDEVVALPKHYTINNIREKRRVRQSA